MYRGKFVCMVVDREVESNLCVDVEEWNQVMMSPHQPW